jgi:hypothetical protein
VTVPTAPSPSGGAEVPPASGPDFLGIGSQKGGTGWLRDQLAHHPAVWIPPIGELHYFDRRFGPRAERMRTRLASRGGVSKRRFDERDLAFMRHAVTYTEKTIDFAWYAQLFAPKGAAMSGDITPGYSTLQDDMVAQIAQAFPGLKIVFLIRDPVERFWSQLAMRIRNSGANFDPEDWAAVNALLVSPEFALRSFPTQTAERWRKFFGREHVFIGQFEDLQTRADWLLGQILEFLRLEPAAVKELAPDHDRKAGAWKPTMTSGIRERLAEHFSDELRRCAQEFGGHAAHWASKYGV